MLFNFRDRNEEAMLSKISEEREFLKTLTIVTKSYHSL